MGQVALNNSGRTERDSTAHFAKKGERWDYVYDCLYWHEEILDEYPRNQLKSLPVWSGGRADEDKSESKTSHKCPFCFELCEDFTSLKSHSHMEERPKYHGEQTKPYMRASSHWVSPLL